MKQVDSMLKACIGGLVSRHSIEALKDAWPSNISKKLSSVGDRILAKVTAQAQSGLIVSNRNNADFAFRKY